MAFYGHPVQNPSMSKSDKQTACGLKISFFTIYVGYLTFAGPTVSDRKLGL
jgi:hypothetical protein